MTGQHLIGTLALAGGVALLTGGVSNAPFDGETTRPR
jgi:hypothetical protein